MKTDTSGTDNNIQETGMTVDDSDNITGINNITVNGVTFPTNSPVSGQVIGATSTTATAWTNAADGDVDGPASATDNAVARFSGATGKLIQNSAVILDDSDNMTGVASININSTIAIVGTLDDDTMATATNTTTATSESIKAYVDGSAGTTFDGFFNSLILEATTITASSDGATWTATITGPGTSDLTIAWSTGLETFDATPAASVGLTTGTDATPVLNYVYIPISTKTLTASTAGWPAAEEFAAVMTVLCQSAATGQTDEAYKVHGWRDDVTEAATDIGHSASLNFWIRSQAATWFSGTALTPTVGVATFDVAVAAGVVLQLHQNDFPALDTGGAAHVNVVNDSVTAYDKVTDLATLLTDANGVTMSNRRFNMVIWGCVSEDSSQCKLFLNLPTASYNSDQGAIDDSDRTAVFTLPSTFTGTGFLISRLSVRHISSSGTWSILQNEDLRGLSPAVATGSGTGGITAIVDDPAPTLGGNLDGGAFDLTNLANATITTNVINSALTANTALTAGASKELVSSATTDTELGYVSGVTSAIQTQIDGIESGGIPNVLSGGNFDTNPWQRGTSFTGVASGDLTADQWRYGNGGSPTAVFDVDKIADAPTVAEAGFFGQNCIELDCTTADVTLAAGDTIGFATYLEGYDFAQIAQRSFSISFWHKHTKTGTYCVSFRNSGSDRSYIIEYTQSTTETWEYASATISASPSAGTWDYTNGRGLAVGFTIGAGSTFQTTADAWQTGSFTATSSQVNASDANTNFFRLSLVCINAGSAPIPFPYRSIKEELELCQRYFCKSYNQGVNPGTVTSAGYIYFAWTASTVQKISHVEFPVTMRASPTVTSYAPSDGSSGNVDTALTPRTGTSTGAGMFGVSIGTNNAVSAGSLAYHFTASADIP